MLVRSQASVNFLLILPLSMFFAFVLMIIPMPDWTSWLRPSWLLLVLCYWAMIAPTKVNLGFAWICGLLLDTAYGTLLGEHALALSLTIFFVLKLQMRLKNAPLLQQGFTIFLLSLLYQILLFCTQGFIGELPASYLYWFSPLTTMLMWPWVFSVLQKFRNSFE